MSGGIVSSGEPGGLCLTFVAIVCARFTYIEIKRTHDSNEPMTRASN